MFGCVVCSVHWCDMMAAMKLNSSALQFKQRQNMKEVCWTTWGFFLGGSDDLTMHHTHDGIQYNSTPQPPVMWYCLMNGWTSGDTPTKCTPLSCSSHRFAVMDFWSFPVLICCFRPGVCSGSFSSCPCCLPHALVLISFTCPWFPSCVYSLCLPRSLRLPAPLRSSPVSY